MESPVIYHDDNQLLSYSSGDRHLLRLYRGSVLSRITFSAIELTRFRDLAEYFDPPLDAELSKYLDAERARALRFFQVPDPNFIDAIIAEITDAKFAISRARRSLQVAAAYGRSLRRDRMFEWIDRALEHDPQLKSDDWMKTVGLLTRNAIAPFFDETEAWVERLAQKHGKVPLVSVMRDELASYRERKDARSTAYVFE